MKRIFLSLSILLINIAASAHTDTLTIGDFVVDVIDNEYAEITKFTKKNFSETLEIPDSFYIESSDKTIPVKKIGVGAFKKCYDISDIVFKEGLEEIGEDAFLNCRGFSSLRLPSSLKVIGRHAFSECRSMTSISFPDSIEEIGFGAFYNCAKLKSVDMSNMEITSLQAIFGGVTYLDDVILPHNLEALTGPVFANMNISEITLPETLKELDKNVFEGNPLRKVDLSNISGLALNKTFLNCDQLTEVIWPDSIRYIINHAFEGTAITDIVINKHVFDMLGNPFSNIQTLRSVKCFVADPMNLMAFDCGPDYECTKREPREESFSFAGSDLSKCVLWVPEGSAELYRNFPMWCDFPDIREMDAAGMPLIKADESMATNGNNAIYDLQGRQISTPLRPGQLYITRGKVRINR